MKRALLFITSVLLLAAEGGSSPARPPEGPEQPPPSPPAAAPAPPAHDPLEEFVPRDRLEADSVVALPVDI
jgi:hypothetical protein